MHVTRVRFGGFPPFNEAIELELDERVNLFIGPNGVGKSNLLRRLYISLTSMRMPRIMRAFGAKEEWNWDETLSLSDDWMMLVQSLDASPNVDYGQRESAETMMEITKAHPPTITIPATSVGHPGLHRNLFRPNSPSNIVNPFGTLSIDEHLESIDVQYSLDNIRDDIERLAKGEKDDCVNTPVSDDERDLMGKYPSMSSQAANLMNAISISYRCARDICQEILVGDSPLNYTVFGDHSDSGLPPGQVEIGVMIQTDDLKPSGEKLDPIHVSGLSSGTELTFWWVRLIALVLLKHNEYRFGWEKRPAILLIDEIENHLHPTWQRRVIPALLKHFPGLQIFATTHSPFVVAGLKAGQVHLLNRDADGVIRASSNDRDIIGWTADQILRTFMGVDEPTDQLTVDRSNRLRELHGKASLTSEEEAELNDLRRQVGESFPLNPVDPQLDAQRERYSDLMERFLRSRMSDAAPDSGEA